MKFYRELKFYWVENYRFDTHHRNSVGSRPYDHENSRDDVIVSTRNGPVSALPFYVLRIGFMKNDHRTVRAGLCSSSGAAVGPNKICRPYY